MIPHSVHLVDPMSVLDLSSRQSQATWLVHPHCQSRGKCGLCQGITLGERQFPWCRNWGIVCLWIFLPSRSQLDPHPTETWCLFVPPDVVHVGFVLHGRVEMFPINLFKLLAHPLIFLPLLKVVLSYSLACMKSKMSWYVPCDLTAPNH